MIRGQSAAAARRAVALLALGLLGACAAPRIIPEPGEQAAPAPPPPPPPAALSSNWTEWPVTPGNWSYASSDGATVARYSAPDGALRLWLQCDLAGRTVALGRAGPATAGAASELITVRTSHGVVQWPGRKVAGAMAGIAAARPARDQGLDWIAYSRGRFTVELPGQPPLVAPPWAEVNRVIEDCRG